MNSAVMQSVSIITTCAGRLSHLQQTLPAMLAQGAQEVIVVDYDCPQNTADWVEACHPAVRTLRARDDEGFSASRARNIGAAQAYGEWLAFVDADNIVQPGWLDWIRQHADENNFFIVALDVTKHDAAGALVCRRADFLLAGKYDEAFRGWGGEDTDLRIRLFALGLKARAFPTDLIQPIQHEDVLRKRTPSLTVDQLGIRAQVFLRIKMLMNRRFGGMERCCREAILGALSNHVGRHSWTETKHYFPVRFHRYCPSCAEALSSNSEIIIHRLPPRLFRPKTYVLTEIPNDPPTSTLRLPTD